MVFETNEEVLLLGKALVIAVVGIFVGFIVKQLTRKAIDKGFLKKVFKDPHVYETSSLINKLLTEVLQWVIIIVALDYSLVLLNFNFLSNIITYIIRNVPKITIFVFIVLGGYLLSKIVSSKVERSNLENKYELTSLIELVVISAFLLTALEYIGVTATALVELFKVILYIIGIIIVLIIINPKILRKRDITSKKK